jgi:hypothetical protein
MFDAAEFMEIEKVDKDILRELLGDSLIPKFCGGLDLVWEEEEFEEILKVSIVATTLKNMKETGLINSFEDEDGEETYFLTEKGKQYSQENDISNII